jgi:hypothetical protein
MFLLFPFMFLQIIPHDFLRRFRGVIPKEIKLETRNGHSYTVQVAKYPDKLVLGEGWGAFVETYHLQIEDSVVLRYNGNSQFNVIVFDRLGHEKASSVVADNAAVSTYVHERHIGNPETLGCSDGHPQPPEMQSPAENVNRYQGHAQPVRMQLPTENMRCSEPQPMQMLSPTPSLDHFVGHTQPMETTYWDSELWRGRRRHGLHAVPLPHAVARVVTDGGRSRIKRREEDGEATGPKVYIFYPSGIFAGMLEEQWWSAGSGRVSTSDCMRQNQEIAGAPTLCLCGRRWFGGMGGGTQTRPEIRW